MLIPEMLTHQTRISSAEFFMQAMEDILTQMRELTK
jgi:hypothetical protein